jgi:ABC-type branched-subunit amino acid transport system substrate-binding protein/serine/threonine protein kinase
VAVFEALAAGDPRQVGRYRVLARLGAGGMGRVFLARSPGGRPVAVKVVRPELAEDPQFRQRFTREVAAARQVNSFFTAGVVDADPEGSPPWLATAYVAGMSLIEAINEHGPWPEASVRALGAGLAEALEAIHAAGLVHRDLKPSNVLLAADGPRVIDFGISVAAGRTPLTQTGAVMGTPGFISPEQLTDGDVGPASDVFALGGVLAFAASGRGPFGEGTAHEVNFRAAYEPPGGLDDLPPGLRGLVGRCLEKDQTRRPGVAALLEELAADTDTDTDTDAGAGAVAMTREWLPEPVSRAVRERTETPLPATPPTPPTPPAAPPSSTAQPAPGTFGPPLPAASAPAPTPTPATEPGGRKPARRKVLAIAGGTAALAGLALAWGLTRPDGGEGGGGGSDGGTGNGGGTGQPRTPRTVRIAVHADHSGDNSVLGEEIIAGARLAVDEANASGDHPRLRFEVLQADDGGLAEAATATAQRVIDDADVLAVVGPTAFDTVMEAGPRYSAAGLAFLIHCVTESELGDQGFDTFLSTVPNDRQSGTAIGEWLARHPSAYGVTVIDNETPYGAEVANAIQDVLVDDGTHYLESRESASSDDSIDAVVQDIIDSGADTVAFLGDAGQASQLAVALDSAGFTGPRITGDRAMFDQFINEAGAAAEGWYLASFFIDPASTDTTSSFSDRFSQAYGYAPSGYGVRAYDATATIIEAIAGLDPEAADRDAVFQALTGTSYQGITGEIRFGDDGEHVGTGPYLYEVTDGYFAPRGPIDSHAP